MENLEVYYLNDVLDYAEENVLFSAELFLSGEQDWNQDKTVANVCHVCDFDEDFIWLASRVLFEDAVRFLLTKPGYKHDSVFL